MPAVSTASPNDSQRPSEPALDDREQFLRMCVEHYENFPVGSWLLPKQSRLHLARIYAFARTADDLADELRDREALTRFREAFVAHQRGERNDVQLFVDLKETIASQDLPEQLFLDLLDAFDQDTWKTRYADAAELRDYCKRSADPVGRLVLRTHGIRDAETDRLSDHVCTGLQILNHVQDLADDLRQRDRLYFPESDLERLGLTVEDLCAETYGPAARALVEQWLEHAVWSLEQGRGIVGRVSGRLRLELKAVIAAASANAEAVRRLDHDVGPGRIRASKSARLRSAFGWMLGFGSPRGLKTGGQPW